MISQSCGLDQALSDLMRVITVIFFLVSGYLSIVNSPLFTANACRRALGTCSFIKRQTKLSTNCFGRCMALCYPLHLHHWQSTRTSATVCRHVYVRYHMKAGVWFNQFQWYHLMFNKYVTFNCEHVSFILCNIPHRSAVLWCQTAVAPMLCNGMFGTHRFCLRSNSAWIVADLPSNQPFVLNTILSNEIGNVDLLSIGFKYVLRCHPKWVLLWVQTCSLKHFGYMTPIKHNYW